MRPRLMIVLLVMLTLPLAGIGWLGFASVRDDEELAAHRRSALLQARLQDFGHTTSRQIDRYERYLGALLRKLSLLPEEIRDTVRKERLVRAMFLLDPEGRLVFPGGSDRSAEERAFLTKTERLFKSGAIAATPTDGAESTAVAPCTWFVWHLDQGLQLIYHCTRDDGRLVGAALDPVVVMSDLIAELPETHSTPDDRNPSSAYRIRLTDVDGEVLYQWGGYDPPADAPPEATRHLSAPLTSFQLGYFEPKARDAALGGSLFGLVFGFSALVMTLMGLGIYFVRESSRDARVARERMTFVNQVSHELKTPLTNLRMYAELLDDYLEEYDEKGRRYVGVIVSESERLSRLIANVLSFARHTRGRLAVRRSDAVPDDIIKDTVMRFVPVFQQADIEVELDLGAEEVRSIDGDALAQIVANLLGNVEKYAAGGRWVGLRSRLDGKRLTVTVSDAGEGITDKDAKTIFEPFVRLSNKLTDQAAGTGIGLSISRELARHLGGDLTLVPSDEGAAFRLDIAAPTPPKETP